MNMITFLKEIVAMPTVTDDINANDAALDYFESFFKKHGMTCVRDRFDGHGTLVASSRSDNVKNPTVLLSGHVDVVDANDSLFHLREEDGKLIGRGVYDMKHCFATYMAFVDGLNGSVSDYDFAIMITTDEEYGGRDGVNGVARLVEQGYRAKVCILPDSAAPNWEVEKLAKGFWRFDLTAKGKTAHGSRPWLGESASMKLLDALDELRGHFKDQSPTTDTLNIALLNGGISYNVIPDEMMAGVEIRYMSHDSLQKLQEIVAELCQRFDLVYRERVVGALAITNLDDPFVKDYMDCIEEVTSGRPKGVISYAATDSIYLIKEGVPCIISCPNGGDHHSGYEWIDKESFLQSLPILQCFMDKVAR